MVMMMVVMVMKMMMVMKNQQVLISNKPNVEETNPQISGRDAHSRVFLVIYLILNLLRTKRRVLHKPPRVRTHVSCRDVTLVPCSCLER